MTVSIVIPAYNEEAGLRACLQDIQAAMRPVSYEYEIVVVDDGSLDNTAKIAQDSGARVLIHPSNRGYGAALKTGIRHAEGDIIVITDADGTYPARYIPTLVNLLQDGRYDMVVGARTGKQVHIPLLRRPAKWLITRFASYLAEMPIPDLNSGLRAFRRATLSEFLHLLPKGFSFTATITLAMLVNDHDVLFYPIDYMPRVGRSKIKPLQDTLNFFALIIRTVMYFRPLKVFTPLSVGLFVLALAVLLGSYLFTPKVMDITTVVIAMTAVQMAALGLLADAINKRERP